MIGVCAVGALVVYDITKDVSFENVKKWLDELKENATADITMMLVGNKIDLGSTARVITTEQGKTFAEQNGAWVFRRERRWRYVCPQLRRATKRNPTCILEPANPSPICSRCTAARR